MKTKLKEFEEQVQKRQEDEMAQVVVNQELFEPFIAEDDPSSEGE